MGRSVTPFTQQVAELEIFAAAMGLYDGAKVRLYKYPFVPSQSDLRADFMAEQAGFDGYGVQTPGGWHQAGTDIDPKVVMPAESVQFLAGGTVISEEIGGYWVENAGETLVLFSVPFPAPVPMAVTGLEEITLSATKAFRVIDNVTPYIQQIAELEVLTAAMGNLDLNLVKLFKFGYTPSELSTIAELDAQECDFTGYMAQAIADWNEAGTDEEGEVVVVADTLQFLATGTAVANNVGGYYVTSADGLTLKFCVALDSPFPMGVTGLEQLPIQATKTYGR